MNTRLPTAHDIRVDIAKQIHYMEMQYGFALADTLTSGDTRRFMDDTTHEAFGAYQALRALLWRIENPSQLGVQI